jgi:site-specific recombinase XerD
LGARLPEWLDTPASTPVALAPPIGEYVEYRRRHRGVAPSSLKRDIEVASAFVAMLRKRRRSIATARVLDIDAFVASRARRVSSRTVADECSSLRAFLRFLHAMGRTRRDLAALVIAPRVRRMSQPPRALPWADVRRLLKSVDRTNPRGRRDFVALLLMASYGMGSAELCGLRLSDVDWRAGVLHVRRAKTGVEIDLPLLPAVARALAAYLRHERPAHAVAREVFVKARLPHHALSGAAVRHLIRKHASAAGIAARMLGAHALRHSHASRQIDLGAPPKIVGDILGHRDPSSTSVYVRVATTRLRAVGLSVPR